jgi:hypothetical protein
MKKIMSLMLGLALLTGTAAVVFSQTDTDKEKQGEKGGIRALTVTELCVSARLQALRGVE